MISKNSNKVMLGFIVRQCSIELGHPPTPAEFASWANERIENGQCHSLFGQPISVDSAKIILKSLGRLVKYAQSKKIER